MQIELPWPPSRLRPNASHQGDYHGKARAARQYRSDSLICALRDARGQSVSHNGPIMLDMRFCAPDNRRRDLDNLLAMSKQAVDAIAEVIGVDDCRFEYTLRRGSVFKGGKVVVTI